MSKLRISEKNKPLIKKIIGAVICLIIYSVCVGIGAPYFYNYVNIPLWCSIGIIAILFALAIWKSKQGLYKIAILTVYFGAIVIVIAIMVLASGLMESIMHAENGEQLYLTLKEQYGNNLYVVLIVTQFLQVTFIPIASSIVTAAGYYLCGQNVWLTILFCCIGLWAGSLFAFFLGRVFGVKLVKWVAGEKVLLKYHQFVKGKDKVMLGYMFIFPVYPDDVLCLIAGLTTMSWREFIFLQLISRPLNVAATVLLLYWGTSLTTLFPLNTAKGIAFWVAAVIVFIATFLIVWKKADKLEKLMTKLISKITGRPILSDINTIYKLSTEIDETQQNTTETSYDSIENNCEIQPEYYASEELIQETAADKMLSSNETLESNKIETNDTLVDTINKETEEERTLRLKREANEREIRRQTEINATVEEVLAQEINIDF